MIDEDGTWRTGFRCAMFGLLVYVVIGVAYVATSHLLTTLAVIAP